MVSNPKKFFKKNYSRFRNRSFQNNFSSDRSTVSNFKDSQAEVEKKASNDSGYDCHYCKGKNHFAKDCMLRKKDEKKEKVND